jgi:integrase
MGNTRRTYGDGSLYFRDSDNRWVGSFYHDGERKYVYGSVGGKKDEARQKLREAIQKAEAGTLVAVHKQTLADYLTYWLSVKKLEIKPSSYVQYCSHVHAKIAPALGKVALQKLTHTHVQQFINAMASQQAKPGSIRMTYAILNMALEKAVKWKYVSSNSCKGITLPRLEDSERVYLSPEQAQALLQAVAGHKLSTIITLALATGLRRGELLGLKWQDINFKEGILQVKRTLIYVNGEGHKEVEPKTKKSKRTIKVPTFALEALKAHRKEQWKARSEILEWEERDLIFPNQQGGYVSFASFQRHWSQVLVQAGLPQEMHFHDLRHSAATLLLRMGIAQKVVQEILGHTTGKMTEKYLHVLPAMREDASAAMDRLFLVV